MQHVKQVQHRWILLLKNLDMFKVKIKDGQLSYLTLFISLIVHASLFLQFNNTAVSHTQAQAPNVSTRISLSLLKEVKPVQQQEVITAPSKPKISKVVKKVKKIIKPAQEQAVAKNKNKEVKREEVNVNQVVRERFLSHLLTHIESFKYYPHAARLRGIEGAINVSFRLLKDGGIENIAVKGRSIQLRRAAKAAVNRALPLPACPEEINCPIEVSYAMQYQIR